MNGSDCIQSDGERVWSHPTGSRPYCMVMPLWEPFALPYDKNVSAFQEWEISSSCAPRDIVVRIRGMEQPFSRFVHDSGGVSGKLYSASMGDFYNCFYNVVEARLDKTVTLHDFAEKLGLGPCPWAAVTQVVGKLLAGHDELGLRVSNAFIYVEPGNSVFAPYALWVQYHAPYDRSLFDDHGGIFLKYGEGEVRLECTNSPLASLCAIDRLSRHHDNCYEHSPLVWFATPN